jgi:hypothetical protein
VRIFSLVIGALATLLLVIAIVDAMLISRSTRSRFVVGINAVVLGIAEAPLRFLKRYEARDRWLTGVGPGSLLVQLTIYAVLLIVSLGLMVFGTTELPLKESLFQSGSTFTTLGIVEPTNDSSALISYLAAFLGLVVIAVFIGYLMSLYSMYSDRETPMARLSSTAGEPAWGPEILARSALLRRRPEEAFDASPWIDWMSHVRMNTGVNPVFALFRSPSSRRHWVTTMLAIMDAASLRLALGTPDTFSDDCQLIAEGTGTLAHIRGKKVHSWPVEQSVVAVVDNPASSALDSGLCGLTSDEVIAGLRELTAAGILAPSDAPRVTATFIRIRSLYWEDAYLLARKHHAVRAPWSGPRKFAGAVLLPERATI